MKIVITGASQGLGKALAFSYAQKLKASENHELELVARSLDSLNQLKSQLENKFSNIKVKVIKVDLSQQTELKEFSEKIQNVDIFVNNAGRGDFGKIIDLDLQQIETLIQLNCTALSYLSRCVAKLMVSRKKGLIINISSLAAFQAIPYFAVYAASKAYVQSFTEALDYEIKPHGVRAMLVSPGGIETQFHSKAGLSQEIVKKYKAMMMTAEQVADEIVAASFRQQSHLIPGFKNRISTFLANFIPRSIRTYLSAQMYSEFLK